MVNESQTIHCIHMQSNYPITGGSGGAEVFTVSPTDPAPLENKKLKKTQNDMLKIKIRTSTLKDKLHIYFYITISCF